MGADVDEDTAEVLQIWGEVLDALARDPMECADRLDWPAKLRLLEGFRERDGLAWNSARGCSWSTCSTPTSGWTRACTTGWWPAAR